MKKSKWEEQNREMPLAELLSGMDFETVLGDATRTRVRDIVYDSRKAKPHTLFIGLSPIGEDSADGADFAAAAWDAGVRAFLLDRLPDALAKQIAETEGAGSCGASCLREPQEPVPSVSADSEFPVVLLTANTRQALALASGNLFDHPSEALKLVAVTGTKGKTTVTFMLKSIFEAAGKKIGVIGTNGIIYGGVWDVLPNTTPESYQLNKILRDMVTAGVEYCFLEASSQGFFLHRTDGLRFDAGVFTNIAPDHISKTEHPDFAHYLACKKRIFDQAPVCYVNRDDEHFKQIVKDAPCHVLTYGFENVAPGTSEAAAPETSEAAEFAKFATFAGSETAHRAKESETAYRATDIVSGTAQGALDVRFRCAAPDWEEDFTLSMPGVFNVSNALAAICVADHYSIPKELIAEGLASAVSKGRMEVVRVPAPYTVLIDYAHNRLSMEKLFEAVESYHPERILCVFGLIGNRALSRRFECGEILGARADYSILANNSPNTDDPMQILADIAEGVERGGGAGRYEIIPDRREAILKLLSMAREGDLVLLAGKGDGPYEEANGVVTPFSERAIVEEYFGK